jgi:hypothetical protein
MEKLEVINEMNLPSLQFFWIEFFENDHNCQSDMNWISKCQSASLSKYHINSSQRIVQGGFIKALKRKHQGLDVRVSH